MKSESGLLFVKQLKENQNIIPKFVDYILLTDEDAFLIVSEITIQLWESVSQLRGDSKFTTWAYRVGLNTAITLYRKRSERLIPLSLTVLFIKVTQDDYNFEEEEKLKLLYSAISELNDIEKALVFLYLEDKDCAEISRNVGD